MAKRGRPAKINNNGINKVIYRELSKKKASDLVIKTKQDKLVAVYEELHLLAYNQELSWSQKERLRVWFKEMGFLL